MISSTSHFLRRARLLGLFALASVGACTQPRTHHAASVVDYLYPRTSELSVDSTVPVLRIPLRVGVAFVPNNRDEVTGLSERDRVELLEQVAARFRKRPFVKSIEIIPTAYLAPGGGFDNVDQLRRMFSIDVVALVSYDQVQFTDEGKSAITYLTLVGAYLIEGEKNDTRTLLDAAVFDIESRRLLFRAPGLSAVKGRSTPVSLSEEQRRDREEGFRIAADSLTINLERELDRFVTRIKESPADVQVVQRTPSGGSGSSGTRGAGAIGGFLLMAAAIAAASAVASRKG